MLKQKNIAITGGSGGIGRATAALLASQGANIALLYDSRTDKAAETCRYCEQSYGITAVPFACDVSDYEMAHQVVSDILDYFGSIHALVNGAGITRDKLTVVMKEQDFDDVVNVNLKGTFNMTRHILPSMVKNRDGCIINISSVSGLMGNRGQSNYAASKAGVIGFTKSIAKEYASRNIRCNAVAPGFIRTDMIKSLDEESLKKQIPLGRLGTPEDVAGAVSYLIHTGYITGEVLRVDGGVAM